jgi:hypothetical protein
MFKCSNLEIKNKQIIEEKDRFVQNLQGVFREGTKAQIRIIGQEARE